MASHLGLLGLSALSKYGLIASPNHKDVLNGSSRAYLAAVVQLLLTVSFTRQRTFPFCLILFSFCLELPWPIACHLSCGLSLFFAITQS